MSMKKFKIAYFIYKWMKPVFDPLKFKLILYYPGLLLSLVRYKRMPGAETVNILSTQPCLGEKTSTSKFDNHYFYQDIWAARKIFESGAKKHIDVGSRVDFVGFLTCFTKVIFVDIRPLEADLDEFMEYYSHFKK